MVRRQLLVATAIFIAALDAAAARAEVLIGVAGPLTGPNAWLGEQTQLGVAVVIGHQCSGAAIPASEVYAEAGILMISNAATNPKLTDRGLGNVFRMLGRDDQQGQIAGRYLAARWGDRKIAIVHDGELYGEGLATYTKQQLNALGVRETLFEQIEPGRVDYSDLVARMRALGVDVLYYGGYAPEAGLIIRQARDKGYQLQLVAGHGITSGDFRLIAGSAADGTRMTLYPDLRASPGAADVAARLRAKHYEPDGATLLAYAAVQAWAQAVKKAGSLETDAVAAAFRSGKFDTVLGRIGFDAKGDVTGYDTFVWYVWQEGKYVPLEP
jgi:branched-chain amino acid transport system substrate-binding protein